jgi:hypothetical protein
VRGAVLTVAGLPADQWPGKRLLSLAFGVFQGVVRAGVVRFILGTGGRNLW